MNWNHLFKAIGVVLMYFAFATFGVVALFGMAYYVPAWLFVTILAGALVVGLIQAQYNHYKRMDEIEADHKKWAREMSDKWDKIK